ncbi:MAG: hypothetical protein ACOCVF_00945 [bacterium]
MMEKETLNKLKKKELVDLLIKHYELNQQFGIFITELLIKFAKTPEFKEFYSDNKEQVDNLHIYLEKINIPIK